MCSDAEMPVNHGRTARRIHADIFDSLGRQLKVVSATCLQDGFSGQPPARDRAKRLAEGSIYRAV
jgi:hypothetical protein